MNRYWIPLAVSAALGLVPGVHATELTRGTRFGSLEAVSADTAKTQAAAWLKAAGKADPATLEKFEQLWKADIGTLDKVIRTLELGDATAAKLMADARDPFSPAPTEVPIILKNHDAPAFLRANLALGYGRALSLRSVHDDALEVLKTTTAEQVVDPSSYLFHRAVSEHALLEKTAAISSINRLLDDAVGSPERHRTLAALMALDIHTWNDKDLNAVARKMKNVEKRLDLSRGGPKTQKIQKEIVARLDEMIKELENQSKCQGGDCNGGNCPGGGPGNGGPPKGNNPSSPATESGIANAGGTGTVDKAKMKNLVEQWGNLPPRERAQALQEMTQGMSPRHREAIENYFRNLAVAQNRK